MIGLSKKEIELQDMDVPSAVGSLGNFLFFWELQKVPDTSRIRTCALKEE
jgi:hypothetical protein